MASPETERLNSEQEGLFPLSEVVDKGPSVEPYSHPLERRSFRTPDENDSERIDTLEQTGQINRGMAEVALTGYSLVENPPAQPISQKKRSLANNFRGGDRGVASGRDEARKHANRDATNPLIPLSEDGEKAREEARSIARRTALLDIVKTTDLLSRPASEQQAVLRARQEKNDT